jgi:hypothetical protein
MALACKYCIIAKGLKGSEIDALPQTEEELFDHLEHEHHIPVRREGETSEQARERLYTTYPEARDPKTCKCPRCTAYRMLDGAIKGLIQQSHKQEG